MTRTAERYRLVYAETRWLHIRAEVYVGLVGSNEAS